MATSLTRIKSWGTYRSWFGVAGTDSILYFFLPSIRQFSILQLCSWDKGKYYSYTTQLDRWWTALLKSLYLFTFTLISRFVVLAAIAVVWVPSTGLSTVPQWEHNNSIFFELVKTHFWSSKELFCIRFEKLFHEPQDVDHHCVTVPSARKTVEWKVAALHSNIWVWADNVYNTGLWYVCIIVVAPFMAQWLETTSVVVLKERLKIIRVGVWRFGNQSVFLIVRWKPKCKSFWH